MTYIELNSSFCMLVSLVLYLIVFFFRLRKKDKVQIFILSAFWIYITLVIDLCFFPIAGSWNTILNHKQILSHLGETVNFTISINYFDVYEGMHQILNVLMLIPMGFLLPIVFKNKKFITYLLSLILIPIAIETLQYILTNHCYLIQQHTDINDVLNNSFGGWIGLSCFYFFKSTIRRFTLFFYS